MNRIIVTEYPKSGGSWLVSLIGDVLSLPKRDIYVSEGFNLFDLSKHFWYEDALSYNLTESCVIKSHELPDSPLHNFPAKIIHLIRDGRDVVISKYFHDKDFCVKNRIFNEFTMSFEEFLEKTAREWGTYVSAWAEKKTLTCRYEELLFDTTSTIQNILSQLEFEVPLEKVNEIIQANTKDKMRKALDKLFEYNTFIRKGIAGDWKNHFAKDHKEIFKKCAGDVLIKLGYESDNNW
jgi:hypothetical protein